MIVFCEECGERNIIDPNKLKETNEPARCKTCNDILRFSMTQTIRKASETIQEKPPEPAPETLAAEKRPDNLELRMGEDIISINQMRPSVTMGRQEHNDLEIIDTRVSRSHARIEYRKGRFILIDHSTNGTYVQFEGKQGINLKRNELPLEGCGIITLGRKVSADSPKAIRFALKT